jgi:hypothetical protein
MQRKVFGACLVGFASATIVATGLRAQGPISSLNYVVLSDLYYDGLYTDGPGGGEAQLVYFVGEQIPVALEIGNAGDRAETLAPQTTSIDDAFEVGKIKGPGNANARLKLEPVGEVVSEADQSVVAWGNQITLQARSRVTFRGTFNGPSAPGYYHWSIVPKGIRFSSELNLQNHELYFELRRPVALADRAEVARRRMIAVYDAEDDVQFEAAARELLRIYPQSSLAFELRGRVAERLGRANDARAAYERATELIRDGQDELYLRHNLGRHAQTTLKELSIAIDRTQAQR